MNTQSKPLFSAILDTEPSIRDAKKLALILNDYLSGGRLPDEETWGAMSLIAGRLLDATLETEAAFDRIVKTYGQPVISAKCA